MATPQKTAWDSIVNLISDTVIVSAAEIHALIPDSILFGSLLLYALTQNMAFGIFTVFLFESILSHKVISWIAAQTAGPSESRPIDVKCRVGYKTPQYSAGRMFSHDPYPSYGVFSLTTIATYLGLATKHFAETMTQMGPEWQGRSMLAYFFIALMLAIYVICRANYCDSIGEIVIAMVLAVMSGAVFFFLNITIFGDEAMNFLGLPFMTPKQSKGQDIYICA